MGRRLGAGGPFYFNGGCMPYASRDVTILLSGNSIVD